MSAQADDRPAFHVRHHDRAGRIDQDQLVLERQPVSEIDRAHSHRQIDAFLSGELLRALEECRLIVLEDHQILFRPDDEARARMRFPAAAFQKPVL